MQGYLTFNILADAKHTQEMKKYKPLIYFLLKFFITYFVLTLGYDYYLKQTQHTKEGNSKSDPYTKEVARESSIVYNILYENAQVIQDEKNPYMNFFVGNYKVALINEGCNSISIMIIMIAFITAFGVKILPTVLYTLFGILFVHTVNIMRISILSRVIFTESPYIKLMHDVFFPGVIYGSVILICILWIQFFIFKR